MYYTLCFIDNHVKLLNGCLSRMVKARYSYNPGVDSPNDCNADVREIVFAKCSHLLCCLFTGGTVLSIR